MIDKGAEGCGAVSCAGWAALSATWQVFGAEGISQIADKGFSGTSTGQQVGAGLEVLAAVPGVGILKSAATVVRGGAKVAAGAKGALVIGRGADLAKQGVLKTGEFSLKWESKLPDFKAEWHANAGRLRQVMRAGNPIRDISPGDTGGIFLNAERALLKDRGWSFSSPTGYWVPPTP